MQNRKNQNLNHATADPAPANPAELIMGWGYFLMLLLAITLLSGVIAMRHTGENLIVVTLAIALVLGLLWSPGLLMAAFIFKAKNRIAGISSTYASARSIFADGIWQAFRRCNTLPLNSTSGVSVCLAEFLTTMIVIGDLGAIFNSSAWILPLTTGMFLSFGGFMVISARLLRDFVRERKLKQQVF